MLKATAMTASPGPRVRSATLSRSRKVLLLVDFINPLRFEGAEAIASQAVEAACATAEFKRDCTAAESPHQKQLALQWMKEHLKARITPAHRRAAAAS